MTDVWGANTFLVRKKQLPNLLFLKFTDPLSQPTLLRESEARLTGASSIGGKCAESPPTFIERKTLEKPKETGHEEYSRFGSYLYV